MGGEGRTLPAFLDFQMLSFGGDARHFLRAFSLGFFVLRKNAHTPGHWPSFCRFRCHFCGLLCTCFCSFFIFWRPRHLPWTFFTQFGTFLLRLGAQGHNVMKPVSQNTLNVRFERIQGSPLGPFWHTFVHFSGFVTLLKLCSRAGGSAFWRVRVRPGLLF